MFKLGLCQTKVYENKDDSIESVRKTTLKNKNISAESFGFEKDEKMLFSFYVLNDRKGDNNAYN